MSDDILSMLQQSAAAFTKADPDRARRFRGLTPGFDAAAWRQIAAQGWLSIIVPEDQGGLGLGVTPVAVVAREFGRAALPEPLTAIGVLGAACLAGADDPAAWSTSLAKLLAGDLLVGVAWQDSLGGIDPRKCEVRATSTPSGIELDGNARLVAVPSADAFIVAAGEKGDLGLYFVGREHPRLAIALESCADGGALAALHFDRVQLAATARLVQAPRAAPILQHAIDMTLIAISAELVGLMDSALEMTLDYLRTRKQFGAPIGSFQALQHRAVDIWIQRQLTDAAVMAAAAVLDDPQSSAVARSAAASGAKARASQAALALCNQALQLHGAIGFADEYGLGIFINRALTLSAASGNAAQHRRRFAQLSPLDGRLPARSGGQS